MKTISEYIETIRAVCINQRLEARALETKYQACDYVKLLSSAEKLLRTSSKLLLYERELVLSLYELMPSLPHTVDVNKTLGDAMKISVRELKSFPYPVYKISLPYLLPNKRKRNDFYENEITNTVGAAVRDFCSENKIWPFEYATVIFVSFSENEKYFIDNDNKESSVILNALNGRLLRDDRPENCNTIYYTETNADQAKTEVYIVESDHDIEVYAEIKGKKCVTKPDFVVSQSK